MPSDKDRIYIALYARGGQAKMPGLEDTYHWAIVVGPKLEDPDAEGTMFHAREGFTTVDGKVQLVWQYQERLSSMASTSMALVRVVVGKVRSAERLKAVLRANTVKGTQPGWNCVSWVKEALQGLEGDGKALGTSKTDWASVRDAAMRYVEEKKSQHRFDGKGEFDRSRVATWDLLEGREIIP